jgi:hypothetical protein
MKSPTSMSVTGSLYSPLRDSWVPPDFASLPGVVDYSPVLSGWFRVAVSSTEPWIETPGAEVEEYIYHFLVRRSESRFLFAGAHAQLVDRLLTLAGIKEAIRAPSVDIARVVDDLTKDPQRYCMSALHARIDGYGLALRSIALYGLDLADAALFRELLPNILPYRVTLRDAAVRSDALSIASRGEVAFQFQGEASLRGVDQALRFLSRGGYVDWRTGGATG